MEFAKRRYIDCMNRLVHPDLKDVSLSAALHALSDPVRLQMVAALSDGGARNCTETCPSVPKSTIYSHFKVLRAAGLVETKQEGREAFNHLRRDAFDARFPGLLDSVLAAWRDGSG